MASSDRMKNARPPAEGERNAISGYHAQYSISASLILRTLREDRLQQIWVADPNAGRVDDIQIGSQSRVDAYQVKWSKHGGNFSFNDLVTEAHNKPCLIAQLADGWTQLQKTHPNDRIVVHLITNEQPSVSDKQFPVSDPPPTPRHFAAFVGQVWDPAHRALQTLSGTFQRNGSPRGINFEKQVASLMKTSKLLSGTASWSLGIAIMSPKR